MAVIRIKKNDTVRVISGRDKGKQGKVTQVFPRERMVVVEGVNLRVKHLKTQKRGQGGSRVQYNAPLGAAKLMVVCPQCGKPTRLEPDIVAHSLNFRTLRGGKQHWCNQPCRSHGGHYSHDYNRPHTHTQRHFGGQLGQRRRAQNIRRCIRHHAVGG